MSEAELVEKMAKRTVMYLNSFENNARAIRGKDKQEIANAYHEVQKNGAMLPPGAPRKNLSDSELASLEQAIQVPAHTVYDHVFISLTAHSLLLSHIEAIGRLSPELANKIDARTHELKSQTKPASGSEDSGSSSKSRFRPLVPPPPLPELTRPTSPTLSPLNDSSVQQMLASPSTLLGKLFFLQDGDMYYRIVSILSSMNGPTVFQLQYEDVSYADDVSETEMKDMLINSAMVHLT